MLLLRGLYKSLLYFTLLYFTLLYFTLLNCRSIGYSWHHWEHRITFVSDATGYSGWVCQRMFNEHSIFFVVYMIWTKSFRFSYVVIVYKFALAANSKACKCKGYCGQNLYFPSINLHCQFTTFSWRPEHVDASTPLRRCTVLVGRGTSSVGYEANLSEEKTCSSDGNLYLLQFSSIRNLQLFKPICKISSIAMGLSVSVCLSARNGLKPDPVRCRPGRKPK